MSTACDQAYDELCHLAFDSVPTIQLFDPIELQKAVEAESNNPARRDALSRLLKSGKHRRLATARSEMMNTLDTLQRRQPNCEDVIDSIRRQVALSLLADSQILRWPPLLLDGPPGIGKTHFVRTLAEALNLPLFMVNCSSVTASFVLGGNSPSWGGSRPGKIVEALRDSSIGNPIILLDEVDKLRGDTRFGGYGPLYQLLEEDTAGIFEDEHIGVPVDASQVGYPPSSRTVRKRLTDTCDLRLRAVDRSSDCRSARCSRTRPFWPRRWSDIDGGARALA